ncbi:MAG: hypothetical protein CMI95_02895 [Pelagibacteraceae bacterium]|nr:hypothetical protein [Pelagibacteraceae bacterium]|tara:strand:+ start:13330 stop:14022 length:693 start_codon:yes stop_codon:yes gene_type:complete
MLLSVIIPCFNEQKNIDKNIPLIMNYFKKIKIKYEIIIIDDYSNNKIKFSNKKIKILRNKKNYGKGYSIKRGIKNSKGDWILFSDSDMSVEIKQFQKFIKFTKKFDLICGSRGLKESVILKRQSFLREFLGKLFNYYLKILCLTTFQDTQCGFKLLNRSKFIKIVDKLSINGFGFDVDLLVLAKINNLNIIEIPIRWKNSENSKLVIFRDPAYMFFEVIIIFYKKLFNKY